MGSEFDPETALFRQVDDDETGIVKVAKRTYHSQFYYRSCQQYGTGFNEIADCVTTLLQVHADKETDLRQEAEKAGNP